MTSQGQIYVIWALFFCLLLSLVTGTSVEEVGDYDGDYEDVGVAEKRHLGSVAASAGGRGFGFTSQRVNHFISPHNGNYGEDDSIKFKRFLGTLARGGWFPRQFRGFVHPNALSFHQKRHIGSVARLGWLPYKSKEENSL